MRARIEVADSHLMASDPTLAALIERFGPCTLMQAPKSHFHTLVWAIINQQLSVKAALSIENKLLSRLKTQELDPQHFKRVRDTSLRQCGLSAAKVRYIREIVRRLTTEELDLSALEALSDEAVGERLMALPGVGRWTADMMLMFSLGRLDILPIGDLALRKSIRLHYGLDQEAGFDAFHALAEHWRPYRSVASWYCWAAVD